ncbi:flagellar biosynthesis protein FlhA [Pseudoalteromonas marina]|uniref:Flagellar biosynthesis protein FlhA n=1 Tax=Pseudoalteromonas marina TaxID=267375 RepID=A0ABT9FC18_9GAMM|nr:flagellar biosynthesis protein FlhA [Pseudoalteromonas marina]MDP2564324.1 flagellar biosynthesis protein FlhA [Pseudoalteromonas marina]
MQIDLAKLDLKSYLVLPIAILCVLGMVVLPLPPFLLDFFFTLNLILSLLILAKVINVDRPLDFSTFPAIILIATLLRLAMNVASTRVILLEGHNGPDAAGSVIESFGEFVIGGQFAVGLIVFTILVVINFIVITKGTGRISEVSARFKLDSLPGKQMAIDADLNAGNVTSDEAMKMRQDLQSESDFYGSMDGASKFVKGDAVAGIIILLINIVGGLVLGVTSYGLTMAEASQSYILLTIGDGIVAQIPGLILSVATGIIITRAGKKETLGDQVKGEFLSSGRNFYLAGGILFVLGLIPGMPNLFFLAFGGVVLFSGFYIDKRNTETVLEVSESVIDHVEVAAKEVNWADIEPDKPLLINVGFGLIDLVQKDSNEMVSLLKGLRKKLSLELGFLISPITVKDDISLRGYNYAIHLFGQEVSGFELNTKKLLAVGSKVSSLTGVKLKEPAYGLDAKWIKPEEKGRAEAIGAKVFKPQNVLITHLSEVIKANASSLFGYDEAKKLLEKTSTVYPELVTEFNDKIPSADILVKVMRMLLDEGVPLRDTNNVLRVLVEQYSEGKSIIVLQQEVRNALGRTILNKVFLNKFEPEFVTIESKVQEIFHANVVQNGAEFTAIEPNVAEVLVTSLKDFVARRKLEGKPCVLLVDGSLRWLLHKHIASRVSGLHVMGIQEIPAGVNVDIIETVSS